MDLCWCARVLLQRVPVCRRGVSRVAVAVLASLLLPVTGATAQCTAPVRVGVLRPSLKLGAQAEIWSTLPPKVRAALGPQYETMLQAADQMMRGMVQETWVAMFENHGVTAVALDADDPAAALAEAKSKEVTCILRTGVTTKTTDLATHLSFLQQLKQYLLEEAPGISEIKDVESQITTTANLLRGQGNDPKQKPDRTRYELTTRYAVTDMSGKTLLAEQSATRRAEDLRTDLWSEDGEEMIAAVLPKTTPGSAGELPPAKRPPPADMTGAARFEVKVAESSTTGRHTRGSGAQGQMVEFAPGFVVATLEGWRAIFSEADATLYAADDAAKTFVRMPARDFGAELGRADGEEQAEAAPAKLQPAGESGTTVRYNVVQPEISAEQAAATEAMMRQLGGMSRGRYERAMKNAPKVSDSVEIEFGAANAAWSGGTAALRKAMPDLSTELIPFAEDPDLERGIWEAVAARGMVPRRVTVRHSMTVERRGRHTSSDDSETTISAPEPPRPEDFQIPPGYRWRSNPGLAMLFLETPPGKPGVNMVSRVASFLPLP